MASEHLRTDSLNLFPLNMETYSKKRLLIVKMRDLAQTLELRVSYCIDK